MLVLGVLLGVSVVLNVMLFVASFRLFNEYEDLEHENKRLEKDIEIISQRRFELTKELYEHQEIFDELAEDPECLRKALDAYHDLCDAIVEDDECSDDMVYALCEGINLNYDTIWTNHYSLESEEITISLFKSSYSEQEEFLLEYLNETYGTNLQNNVRTQIIFTVLHELGHYVDYSNKKNLSAKEYESYLYFNNKLKRQVDDMEDELESWKAYRQVPEESFADKFAVQMMLKHFPELC